MKRGRREPRELETLYGVNPVMEAIAAGRRKVHKLLVKKGAAGSKAVRRILDLAGRRKIPVELAGMDAVAKAAGAEGSQGVAAIVTSYAYANFESLMERAVEKPRSGRPLLAVLDGVMDPRNLGAIIRSAAAFGFDGVIIPRRRASSYTPAAAKASAGMGERFSICRVTNVAAAVDRLRAEGFWTAALDNGAGDEFSGAPAGPVGVVLGGEGTGVRPLVKKKCGAAARIPMSPGADSLNVAAAAAVAFYIVSRGG